MKDLFDNPMGLDGFEFVEFSAPAPGQLEPIFETLGFVLVAKHRSKDTVLYRQGDINFIINYQPQSNAYFFGFNQSGLFDNIAPSYRCSIAAGKWNAATKKAICWVSADKLN